MTIGVDLFSLEELGGEFMAERNNLFVELLILLLLVDIKGW